METAAERANSKLMIPAIAEEPGNHRRPRLAIGPVMGFNEVLAQCKPEGDIVASLCAASGLPHGYLALEKAWPWITKRIKVPCGCALVYPSALMTLCHLYDRHVLDLAEWSMPELVEWTTRMQSEMAGSK